MKSLEPTKTDLNSEAFLTPKSKIYTFKLAVLDWKWSLLKVVHVIVKHIKILNGLKGCDSKFDVKCSIFKSWYTKIKQIDDNFYLDPHA